ncbi:hypothetical protein CVT25_010885, partial [Psilocybe cyanescens]
MAPLFPFLTNLKNDNQQSNEKATSQSQAHRDMGNDASSKKKLRKPGPNRIVTNMSKSNLVEPQVLKTSQAPDLASNHGLENNSSNQMQHDWRQRPTLPPPYSPSHDDPIKYPPLANSIISGHFLSEGSRYPQFTPSQFTPSQARSWTVPSVRRASFPEEEAYEEEIEDESWVNNQTQSSHNLARHMRDPRISVAPTAATVGQDETFHDHEQLGYQPTHMGRQETGDGPFGTQEIDENVARRQRSQRSNRPQEIGEGVGTQGMDQNVARRQGSQRSNRPQEINDSVGTQGMDQNVARRQRSQRSNRPQEIDESPGTQRTDRDVARRQRSQR